MLLQPITTEYVCEISHEDQTRILQDHFIFFYFLLSQSKLIPSSSFERIDGICRCLSGIPIAYHNAVRGYPTKSEDWDLCIQRQLKYFYEANMPFVWYVDKKDSEVFKQKLIDYGFQDAGVFRGVMGILDKPIADPNLSDDCVIELLNDEAYLDEFNQLVCSIFGIEGTAKDLYKQALKKCTQNHESKMFHWFVRKQGKVISALTTLIKDDVVSFWNGATLPEFRRQGLSTALRSVALKDAISRGCRIGVSYLMSEGMALGICSNFGYQTKWRFNVYVSPSDQNDKKQRKE